ncbi:MAG: DUF4397 domain-containing protein [Anaerolineales bacterium]|nr:DUF4397 domain-containing protein [Anaerolineales bacterium]
MSKPIQKAVPFLITCLLLLFGAMAALLPGRAAADKPTIVEIASGDDRFETLVAALQAAELVDDLQGEGPFTVFAPTDHAFAKLPDGALEALLNDIPTLQKILLYHVAAGKNMAADVVQLTELETLQGEKVQIRVEGHKVFVNDAQIIITDIEASNGVIHVIDTVLIPPSLQPKTIVDIAVADDRFETLVAALQAADLVETLQGDGPFTVFAPTDDAFAKLPAGTLEALLNDIPALKEILLYHVVPGKFLAADVVQQTELTTAKGDKVKIKVEGGKVFVNDAQIIITDIEASNGVIHVIDTVLIPPPSQPKTIVDIAVADDRFETLVAALQAADLVETLQGDGPFTVLAPTDDAFAKLSKGGLKALLNNIPTLKQILLYHVVAGKAQAADVVQQTELTTVQGEKIKVRVEGDKVFINDAQIIITDIEASNGVIHVIDTVLTPPSLRPKVHVTVVHGIPGQALGADPALPVDVSVDGECVLPGFTFSKIAGPLSLPVDTYRIAISLANTAAPCSNAPVIGPLNVPVAKGENVSIVAHLNGQGEPTASKFVNNVSLIRAVAPVWWCVTWPMPVRWMSRFSGAAITALLKSSRM